MPHGQYQNNQNHQYDRHHHHHQNQPQPCQYPQCLNERQPPTRNREFNPPESHHTNHHDRQHDNKPWSNPDPYPRIDDEYSSSTTPLNKNQDRWGESSHNYAANYPMPQENPRYPSGNRGSYGRTKPDFSNSGGNIYVDNTYHPPGYPGKKSEDEIRSIWMPNSGPYGDYHDSKADESMHPGVTHIFNPNTKTDFKEYEQKQQNSYGEYFEY